MADITNSLRSLMVRQHGHRPRPGRTAGSPADGGLLVPLCAGARIPERPAWELQNLLTIARLMIASALAREESRGVHFRSDFSGRDDKNWARHLNCDASVG